MFQTNRSIIRSRPHVPEKRSFFPVFEKIHGHTGRIVFARPQENAYKMEIQDHALQAMRCMIYNINVFENLRFQFVLQDENDKPVFSHAFSVTVFTGYLWIVGQSEEKTLRSQTKTNRCEWGQYLYHF